MGTAELRKAVRSVINKSDDKFLKKVLALAKSHDEEEEDSGSYEFCLFES